MVRLCPEHRRKLITERCLKLAYHWKMEEGKTKDIIDIMEEWNMRSHGRKRSIRMSVARQNCLDVRNRKRVNIKNRLHTYKFM